MKKDNRKIKTLESIWEAIGVPFNEYTFMGHIMAHFESLHLGLRKVVCININAFSSKDEAMLFVNRCCKEFNCDMYIKTKVSYGLLEKIVGTTKVKSLVDSVRRKRIISNVDNYLDIPNQLLIVTF